MNRSKRDFILGFFTGSVVIGVLALILLTVFLILF